MRVERWLYSLPLRFRSMFRRDGVERDLDDELRDHIERETRANIARGMSPAGARRAALVAFGGVQRYKEEARDTRRVAHIENFLQDTRYAVRVLRKSPVFTTVAVLTIALGIAANTAIFSVVSAVLLKPLPYPDPDRMVMFTTRSAEGESGTSSPAKFAFWRRSTSVVRDIAAVTGSVASYAGAAGPEQLTTGKVSGDFFRLFGAHVIYGRAFSHREELPGGDAVVVLSHALWMRRFGSDPAVVGRAISLSGVPYVVIGVLGEFSLTEFGPSPDAYLPSQLDSNSTDQGDYLVVWGRLKPGVTLAQADAALQRSTAAFRRAFPGAIAQDASFSVVRLADAIVADAKLALLALFGAVCFVLLMACANVASLLLARATARRREIAIRAAVGASRSRIMCQLLTESVILALGGGVLGLALGMAGIRSLLMVDTAALPPRLWADGSMVALLDWRVLLFTVGVSAGTGVLFGVLPALSAASVDLTVALKEGSGRAAAGVRQNRGRSLLVVTEMALAVVLLVGSGLLMRSVVKLRRVDPGFDANNVLVASMSLTGKRFLTSGGVEQAVDQSVERIRTMPGVENASAAFGVPLQGSYSAPFTIVGRPIPRGDRHGDAGWVSASPGYFEVMRIPVRRGRAFTVRDDSHAPPVVIINEAMARRFWPDSDPTGQWISIGRGQVKEFAQEPPRMIVGVVGSTRDDGLDSKAGPRMFVPLAQVPDAFNALLAGTSQIDWVVRMTGAPSRALRDAIANELTRATGLPVASMKSMGDVVSTSTAGQRLTMWLMTIFGSSALLLAAIGIYGLAAFAVVQRTQEIGIRRALGASGAEVRRMVVGQGARFALIGVAVGVAGALALARTISSLLFGVTAWDPLVFIGAPLLLMAVALMAVWWPAQRATRIDPSEALRAE